MDKIKSIRVIGALGLTMMLSSCIYDPYYYDGPPYHSHESYYPYGYYYYPSVRVYFQYSTGLYFYHSDGLWRRSRVLPPHIRLHARDRVPLRIQSGKPYKQHRKHVEKYRPRPDLKPTRDHDRHERKSHRKWYKEQQYNKNKQQKKKKQKKQDEEKEYKKGKREKRKKDKRYR